MRREALVELNRPLATITPTLDGDVLTVLARHDSTFTTGQLHRILTSYSEEGIRRVLQRLTRQGVVRSDRVGNAFAYRLNRDHLAAEHIIKLAALMETLIQRIEQRLASWEYAPVYAAVFGSVARGSMTADSDLDLLLVRSDDTPQDRWDDQVAQLCSDLTRWLGNDVRPLQFTAAEVTERGRQEPVLRDALSEGLTVAGSRDWLRQQLDKTAR